MMSVFIRTLACAGMLLIAQRSSANPIEAGDWVHFNGSLGTLGGGAFKIHDLTAAVPEPGTIVLLGTGVAAAIRRRRRSRVTAG